MSRIPLRLVHGSEPRPPTALRRSANVDDVNAARSGDVRAREALYLAHVDEVTRLCAFMLRRNQDVDDVIQDAFVVAFDKLHTLRDPAVFGGWLMRIAANECKRRLRRRRLKQRLGLWDTEDITLDEIVAIDATAEERLEVQRTVRALERLDPDDKVAWTMRHLAGFSLEEVADAIHVSLATVKRRLAAAEARLANQPRGDAA